jgi:hypothetical protein
MNICGHCNEAKATDACVICDKDLCPKDQRSLEWRMYYADRTPEYRAQNPGTDMAMALGPFCEVCWGRHGYKIQCRLHHSGGPFEKRFRVAAQNVGNAIAREMFREEADNETT